MKITNKKQVIARLNKIAEYGWRGYKEEVIISDWVKNDDLDRTYFKIRETDTGSRHFCEYNFGYWDNVKNVFVAGRCDLNWSLHGSDIGLEHLEF